MAAEKAPRLSFSLASPAVLDGKSRARLGNLTFEYSDDAKRKTVATPGCISYTRRGAVPHLTRDNVERLPIEMVHLSLENLLDFRPPLHVQAPFSLHRYVGLHATERFPKQKLLTMSARDFSDLGAMPTSTQHAISLRTGRGNIKMTPGDFLKYTLPRPPDIVFAFADDPLGGDLSRKRMAKSISRSLDWTEQVVNGAKGQLNIFATLVGSSSLEARTQFSALLAASPAHDSLCGFVLDVITSRSSSPSAGSSVPELFNASLHSLQPGNVRTATSSCGPHEVLRLIDSCGMDLFTDDFSSHCATIGAAFDFKFPAPSLSGNRKLSIGHNLFDLSFAEAFVPIASSVDDPVPHPFGPHPPTRAYVHHLLHSHEMTANIILAMNNTLVMHAFFESIRNFLAREPENFATEVARFFAVYDIDGQEFSGGKYRFVEEAAIDCQAVNGIRGKGSLREKRLADAAELEEEVVPVEDGQERMALREEAVPSPME